MLDYLRLMLTARLARRDERGASAVEYGLLVAGIAGIIVLTVFVFGAQVGALFQDTCDSISAQRGAANC